MADLVSFAEAAAHLRVPDDDNEDVALKISEASEIIIDYLKSQADDTWDSDTVPGPVKAAVLLMLTHLYEHRGDDMASDEAVWAAIERLLRRSRDPAVA